MGAALYIVLEKEIPGFDPFVNGKALSAAERSLDRLAKELGVTPLMEFFSADPEEALDFLEAEADAGGLPAGEPLELPAEQWFAAADGLATVRAVKQHLIEHPDAIRDSEGALGDLDEFDRVLERAAAAGVRWHLAVDF